MGTIVEFPAGQRATGGGRYVDANSEPANIIILPVVRIERHSDNPTDDVDGGPDNTSGRQRRRRVSRP